MCLLASGSFGCSSLDAAPAAAPTSTAPGAARIRPPAPLTCDRNHLTAWFGAVSGYRREASRTWLQISTDYDTVEETTIDHAGAPDASAHYLLWGATFTALDWPSIEVKPGELIKGMRAIAWICDDGETSPVIDWQPHRE